jgi:hypothetical protein
MIGGPPCRFWYNPGELQRSRVHFINKNVDYIQAIATPAQVISPTLPKFHVLPRIRFAALLPLVHVEAASPTAAFHACCGEQ